MANRKGNWVDRIASAVSPKWAAERALWRRAEREASYGYRNAQRSRTDRGVGLSGHPDAINEMTYDRLNLVNRARELERNNQIASAMLDRWVENVIGCGFKLQARSENEEWNEQVEALWEAWVIEADTRGIDNFAGLLKLAARSYKRDGDVGVILVDAGPRAGTIQLLESDQIKTPPGMERSSEKIVDGVEIDAWGRPTAFHVIDPGAKGARIDRRVQNRLGQLPTSKIPAHRFVHVASRTRVGQTRGISVFAQSAWLFEQLDAVIEATVSSARIAACFGVVLRKPGGFPGLSSITGANSKSYKAFDLEPAMVKTLEPGEDISTLNPAQPQQNMVSFVRMLGRLLGIGFAFPLELVLLDFSETNYSSARAALLQAQRAFRAEQQFIIHQLCRRIYNWRVDMWIEDGELGDCEDKHACQWITPGWKWVDPEKEVSAQAMAIDIGLKTLTECHAEQSGTVEEYVAVRARELAMLEEAEIELCKSGKTRDTLPPPEENPAPGAPGETEAPEEAEEEDKDEA